MNFPNLGKQATIRRARQAIRSPTPIKTPEYFFGDFFSDEELDSAMQQPTSESAGPSLAETLPSQQPTTGGKTVDEDCYKALERQAEEYQKQDEASEDEGTTPISTPDEDAIPSSSPPTEHDEIPTNVTNTDALSTTPVAPSPDSDAEIEEDFDWYQYPARPGEKEGRWTPQYAHARRAPRVKGKVVNIWVERTKTFFSFPPEVRQRIYKYALFPRGIEGHAPRPWFSHVSTWKVKVPALLQASFDVRREAIPYYYNEIRVGCSETMYAKMWLSKIGKEARLTLGAVTVRFDARDKRNKTEQQQRLRYFSAFRAAGVEVRKDTIHVV